MTEVSEIVNQNEIQAQLKIAQITKDIRFLQILQKQIFWKQQQASTPKRIEDDDQLELCVNIFEEMKNALKTLEEVRLEYVAFPTKVINMINGLFRQVRVNVESSKIKVGQLISARQAEKQAEFERAEEARRKALDTSSDEAKFVAVAEGQSKVQFEPVEITPPSNSISSKKGAKVVMRNDFEIEVVNFAEFLTLLTSRSVPNSWITVHAEKILSVNLAEVKRLVKEHQKLKVKGLKITKVQRAV